MLNLITILLVFVGLVHGFYYPGYQTYYNQDPRYGYGYGYGQQSGLQAAYLAAQQAQQQQLLQQQLLAQRGGVYNDPAMLQQLLLRQQLLQQQYNPYQQQYNPYQQQMYGYGYNPYGQYGSLGSVYNARPFSPFKASATKNLAVETPAEVNPHEK
uniref:Uncharacterized protein n=1 Tax=Panagrolaimus sp. JU765 TaxID=591449 RepID=A0AC34Q256_9BILA